MKIYLNKHIYFIFQTFNAKYKIIHHSKIITFLQKLIRLVNIIENILKIETKVESKTKQGLRFPLMQNIMKLYI